MRFLFVCDRLVHVQFVLQVRVELDHVLLLSRQHNNSLRRSPAMRQDVRSWTDLSSLCELTSDSIDVGDPLSWIIMTYNLSIEFTQPFCLFFC